MLKYFSNLFLSQLLRNSLLRWQLRNCLDCLLRNCLSQLVRNCLDFLLVRKLFYSHRSPFEVNYRSISPYSERFSLVLERFRLVLERFRLVEELSGSDCQLAWKVSDCLLAGKLPHSCDINSSARSIKGQFCGDPMSHLISYM